MIQSQTHINIVSKSRNNRCVFSFKKRVYICTRSFFLSLDTLQGADVALIVRQLDLQLPVQSVPNTTEVVSSNPAHGEMYSIQPYVIKFVSDLRQFGGFLRVILVSSTKHGRPSRNIVEHNNNNPLDKLQTILIDYTLQGRIQDFKLGGAL